MSGRGSAKREVGSSGRVKKGVKNMVMAEMKCSSRLGVWVPARCSLICHSECGRNDVVLKSLKLTKPFHKTQKKNCLRRDKLKIGACKASGVRREMQALVPIRPRFAVLLSSPRLRTGRPRAFSSHYNQSRGGLPRFFSPSLPASKGAYVHVEGDEFRHMTKVLRLRAADRVELFNGKGGLVECCIEKTYRDGVDIVALEDPILVSPSGTQWHVFSAFGTLKGGRADWLVEKCTELGANSVTPLLTERSSSISDYRSGRLQRVTLAAVKQCQRLHEMILNPPMKFDSLLPIVAESRLSFVAAAESTPVINALNLCRSESSGLIIVGPEGDFTEKEMKMMVEAGATVVGLGPHRLRVETATMGLLATVMLWSDSQQTSSS